MLIEILRDATQYMYSALRLPQKTSRYAPRQVESADEQFKNHKQFIIWP